MYVMGRFALGLSCLGFSGFLGLGWLFPFPFQGNFQLLSLQYFLVPFLFIFFFWDFYDSTVEALNVVLEVSEVVLIFFFLILLLHSASLIPAILSSTSLIVSSASLILLLVPSRVFLIPVSALFIIDSLFYFF